MDHARSRRRCRRRSRRPRRAPSPLPRPWPRRLGCRAARCRPLNQRRWRNFKANRRGYWSLWIFLGAVRRQPVRRVHRQRQADHRRATRASCCSRCWSTIRNRSSAASSPSPTTRTRSSSTRSRPTAGCSGRRSATPTTSINKDYPRPQEARTGSASASRRRRRGRRARRCARRRPISSRAIQALGNRNWLGTDDQGRDVLARVIYGFRISVLFGLLLTILSSIIGVTAGAVQGYFGGTRRSRLPALPRDLVVDPLAVRADHHLVGAGAGLLDAARHAAAVPLGRPRRRGARRVPARAQFRVHHGGARARPVDIARSCSSTCCRTRWWRR